VFVLFHKQCVHTDLTVGVKPGGSIRVLLVASGFWTAQVRTKSSRALLVSEGPLLPARRAHFSSYVRFEPRHFDVWNVVLRDAGHCNYTFPSAWRARCFVTLLKRWQAWEIRGGSEVIFCGRRIIEWTRTKVWKALVSWNRHTRNLGQMMISRGRCNTSGASGSCVVASTVLRRPHYKNTQNCVQQCKTSLFSF